MFLFSSKGVFCIILAVFGTGAFIINKVALKRKPDNRATRPAGDETNRRDVAMQDLNRNDPVSTLMYYKQEEDLPPRYEDMFSK